jgi:hypothetical protein
MEFKRQRKTGTLGLTRERNRNDRSGAVIENVLAQNQNWTLSRLFSPPYWI